MTSTLISLSRIEYEITREIIIDYLAMVTQSNMHENKINAETQAKLADGRYILERLSDALI